jgi:hypothetical protein
VRCVIVGGVRDEHGNMLTGGGDEGRRPEFEEVCPAVELGHETVATLRWLPSVEKRLAGRGLSLPNLGRCRLPVAVLPHAESSCQLRRRHSAWRR